MSAALRELAITLEHLKVDQETDRSYLEELQRKFSDNRRRVEALMKTRQVEIVEIERAIQVLESRWPEEVS